MSCPGLSSAATQQPARRVRPDRRREQPADVHPHEFPRLFATDALRSGLPPHIAAKILGHADLATTMATPRSTPRTSSPTTGLPSPAAGPRAPQGRPLRVHQRLRHPMRTRAQLCQVHSSDTSRSRFVTAVTLRIVRIKAGSGGSRAPRAHSSSPTRNDPGSAAACGHCASSVTARRGDVTAQHLARREAGLAVISHEQRHHRIRGQLRSCPGAGQGR